MDMAVANLFKYKAHFEMGFPFPSKKPNGRHPNYYRFYLIYFSHPIIENLRSMGVTDINELCLKCLKPFMVYNISKLVTEQTRPIKRIIVSAKMEELEPIELFGNIAYSGYKPKKIYSISLDNPKLFLHVLSSNSKMTIRPIEKRLFDKPFSIQINVDFDFLSPVFDEIISMEQVRYLQWEEEKKKKEDENTI